MGQVLSEQHRAFLEANHGAVMATVDDHGRPHAVPVLCALIDGELWSSGTDLRVRTRHLGVRPYATLTVLTSGFWGEWLTVGGPVEIRRDPDDLAEYRAAMVAERRLVYVLTPEWVYPSSR